MTSNVYFFAFLVGISCSSCAKKSNTAAAVGVAVASSCTASEDLSSIDGTTPMSASQPIGQAALMNGTVGETFDLSNVRVFGSTNALSSITLRIYRDAVPKTFTFDAGTLLGTSIVTTGLGSSNAATPIDFPFSSAIGLSEGSSYSFIVTGLGGAYTMSNFSPSSYADGELATKTTGTWNSIASTGLAMTLTYSGCSGN